MLGYHVATVKTLVRPHVEYCVKFWLPLYKKDVVVVDKVLKKFTKMFPVWRVIIISKDRIG